MNIKETIHSDVSRLASLTEFHSDLFLQTGSKGYRLMLRKDGGANPATIWRKGKDMADFLNDMLNIMEKSRDANVLHNWWELETGDTKLSSGDLEYIGESIKEGYTSGQIMHDDEDDEEEDDD
jgi:hypothetical protein